MKRLIKIIVISVIILISICILSQKSYAAMEIKAGTGYTNNITVSNSFAYCYNLRASSTTLGNNTLDPHLTLNSDWGAVVYLAASVYGTNGANASQIMSSTTGNESGVKNMGLNYTHTASLYGMSNDSRIANLRTNINTKYVEELPNYSNSSKTGQAFAEVAGWVIGTHFSPSSMYPVAVRFNPFGFYYADSAGSSYGTVGQANNDTTFRPVIWNK